MRESRFIACLLVTSDDEYDCIQAKFDFAYQQLTLTIH
jgi:hypothetical protein